MDSKGRNRFERSEAHVMQTNSEDYMFGHERPKECEGDADSTRGKDRRNKYIVSKKKRRG